MVVSPAERTAVVAACLIAAVTLAELASGQVQRGRPAPPANQRLLTYYIAPGETTAGYHASDRELALWAMDAWSKSAAGAFRLEPVVEAQALLRLYWTPPDGNTYGEMRSLVVGGQPGAAVFVRPDTRGLLPESGAREADDPLWRETIVYLTCLHELGHALGLAHTADERDIMYSFTYGGDIVQYLSRYRRQLQDRSDIRSVSGLSASDVSRLRSLHPAE